MVSSKLFVPFFNLCVIFWMSFIVIFFVWLLSTELPNFFLSACTRSNRATDSFSALLSPQTCGRCWKCSLENGEWCKHLVKLYGVWWVILITIVAYFSFFRTQNLWNLIDLNLIQNLADVNLNGKMQNLKENSSRNLSSVIQSTQAYALYKSKLSKNPWHFNNSLKLINQ